MGRLAGAGGQIRAANRGTDRRAGRVALDESQAGRYDSRAQSIPRLTLLDSLRASRRPDPRMADYYSLLAKAVSNLPKAGPEPARKAIYDRARKALVRQLRSLGPALSEADIAREEAALEAAIGKLEGQFSPAAPTPPSAAGARPSPPPPRPGRAAAVELRAAAASGAVRRRAAAGARIPMPDTPLARPVPPPRPASPPPPSSERPSASGAPPRPSYAPSPAAARSLPAAPIGSEAGAGGALFAAARRSPRRTALRGRSRRRSGPRPPTNSSTTATRRRSKRATSSGPRRSAPPTPGCGRARRRASTGRGAARRRGSSPRWWSASCCRSPSSPSCGGRIRKTWRSRSRSRRRRRKRPPAPPRSSSGSAARRRRRRPRPTAGRDAGRDRNAGRRGDARRDAVAARRRTPRADRRRATPAPPAANPGRRGRRARRDAGRGRLRSAEAGGQPRLGGVEHDPAARRPAGVDGRGQGRGGHPRPEDACGDDAQEEHRPEPARLAHHRPARHLRRRRGDQGDQGYAGADDAPRRSPVAGCAVGRAGEDLRQLLPGRAQPRRRRAGAQRRSDRQPRLVRLPDAAQRRPHRQADLREGRRRRAHRQRRAGGMEVRALTAGRLKTRVETK